MELGWSCREKNKQSIDDPQHLSSARPGDTEGTKEDKRRNGGTTSTVSKQKKKYRQRVAQNRDQWRSVGNVH